MSLFQFVIKCPDCKSSTTLVAFESNPLIFECAGCHKSVVMQGTTLYTVSNEYVSKIKKKYKTLTCGQVMTALVSEEAKSLITDKKINDLRTILSDAKDVNDILKSI